LHDGQLSHAHPRMSSLDDARRRTINEHCQEPGHERLASCWRSPVSAECRSSIALPKRSTALGETAEVLRRPNPSSPSSRPSHSAVRESEGTSFTAAAFKYSSCMRDHGLSSFPDPMMTDHDGQQVAYLTATIPAHPSPAFKSAQTACQRILPPPINVSLTQLAQQRQAREQHLLTFAECLRNHGIPTSPIPPAKDSYPPRRSTRRESTCTRRPFSAPRRSASGPQTARSPPPTCNAPSTTPNRSRPRQRYICNRQSCSASSASIASPARRLPSLGLRVRIADAHRSRTRTVVVGVRSDVREGFGADLTNQRPANTTRDPPHRGEDAPLARVRDAS